MANFNNGYKNIKVKILSWPGNDFAKNVYEFGRLSNDFNYVLTEKYDENHPDCVKLIDKIVNGTTLPKFALVGNRIQFKITDISRICLAQLTRDSAIFASQGGGVFPLSQNLNIPMSVYQYDDIMEKIYKAQMLLEEAHIMACEREIPALEARYIGLHCQTISLTASYTITDFVRSCYSRTSGNFCDECNYVYRLMYAELEKMIESVTDINSKKLYKWCLPKIKCIYDGFYNRERLYNSDFTANDYSYEFPAINDWRKSCWKMEMERMLKEEPHLLTDKEKNRVRWWISEEAKGNELPTTYDATKPDVAKNMIKTMDYYKEHRNDF